MRVQVRILIALFAAAAVYTPATSHACDCALGTFSSDPSNAQTGVPRNRAIQLNGPLDPSTVVLRTVSGEPHAFEQRAYRLTGPCGGDHFIELIPMPALEPTTQYEVRAIKRTATAPNITLEEPVFARFTTSDELLPDPELDRPIADLSLVKGANTGTSCGPYAATGCLIVDDPAELKLILRDGDTVTSELPLSQVETQLILWTMPTCIDVVRQAPTGRRSPALSFCGDDLKLLTKAQNQCQGGPFGAPIKGDSEDSSEGTPPRPLSSAAGESAPQPMAAGGERALEIHGCNAGAGNGGSTPFALLLGVVALLRVRRRSD
jgi:MYXO-CTERM domain-containing protein